MRFPALIGQRLGVETCGCRSSQGSERQTFRRRSAHAAAARHFSDTWPQALAEIAIVTVLSRAHCTESQDQNCSMNRSTFNMKHCQANIHSSTAHASTAKPRMGTAITANDLKHDSIRSRFLVSSRRPSLKCGLCARAYSLH